MARTNGPIQVWHRGDTIPTDAEGGYAGGDSTAAAVGTSLAQAGQAVATVGNLAATATALPAGASPTVTVTGVIPNKVINIGIPRGADGAPGMGYEEGQQLLAQNQTTLDAAQAAQTSAASSASDAADAVTLAQQAQAAALEVPDANVSALIGNPATETHSALTADTSPVVGKGDLMLNVKDFGAVGDDVADDTAAIQAAIDQANISGGRVYLPAGRYALDGTLELKAHVEVHGAGRRQSTIRSRGGLDMWSWTGTNVQSTVLSSLRFLQVGAGHIFNLSGAGTYWVRSSIRDCDFTVLGDASSIVRMRTGAQMIFFVWDNCDYTRPGTSTVPGFDVVTTGPNFNSVSWIGGMAHSNGATAAPMFHIENASGVNRNMSLTWDNVTGERSNGGFIHVYAGNGVEVRNSPDWDAIGDYVAPPYRYASSGGFGTVGVHQSNSFRTAGSLGAGVPDIDAADSKNRSVHIYTPSRSGAGSVVTMSDNVSVSGDTGVPRTYLSTAKDGSLPPPSVDIRGAIMLYRDPMGVERVVVCRWKQGSGAQWVFVEDGSVVP